jgi:hypothetical protein
MTRPAAIGDALNGELTIVISSVEEARRGLDLVHPAQEWLVAIQGAARRMASIAAELPAAVAPVEIRFEGGAVQLADPMTIRLLIEAMRMSQERQ